MPGEIVITVNGSPHTVQAAPDTPLLYVLRNELGEFHGRAKIDRIAAGNLQGYWPEVNGLVPAGCLDASGVPHYNAFVEVVRLESPLPAAGQTIAQAP